jgi:hypothetical protein
MVQSGTHAVPQHIAHGVTTAEPGHLPQVFIAMSKAIGRPIDQTIYGMDQNDLMKLPVKTLLDGPLPDGCARTLPLQGAVDFITALVVDVVPVLQALGTRFYHRDISSHNVMLALGEQPGDRPKFSILDFGAAVRAAEWQRDWGASHLAGDPRYWSPAAWLNFTYGHKYLRGHPNQALVRQYQHRLDHYAFGMLCAEVFFAVWSGAMEGDARQQLAMDVARSAWRAYWSQAMAFYQAFHNEGVEETRVWLRAGHVNGFAEKQKAQRAFLTCFFL